MNQLIHERAVLAAQSFRKAEAELLDALRAVEEAGVFAAMGYPSLFVYATHELRLTEAVAYASIQVMRKAREVPELREKIISGELSVSTARKIVPVLNATNQGQWLKKATELSSRILEKEVARENPRAATVEKAKYTSDRRIALNIGVDESLMLKFRQAQNLVSGSIQAPASMEATLEQITEFYLKHKDPVRKAERVVAKKGLNTKASVPARRELVAAPELKVAAAGIVAVPTTNAPQVVWSRDEMPDQKVLKPGVVTVRTAVPAAIAHAVRFRDQGKCQAKLPGGTFCHSKRWTELHHILPVAQGGKHESQNLITLCSAHHSSLHGTKLPTRPQQIGPVNSRREEGEAKCS